jgi:hypothetical protein
LQAKNCHLSAKVEVHSKDGNKISTLCTTV